MMEILTYILYILGIIGLCFILRYIYFFLFGVYYIVYDSLSDFWEFLKITAGCCVLAILSMGVCWVLGNVFKIPVPYWLFVPFLCITFFLAVRRRIRDKWKNYETEEESKRQEEEQRGREEQHRQQEEKRRREGEQHRSQEEQQKRQKNRQMDDILDEIACYAVFGCAPDISDADLKTLYHKLVKENHPDRMGPDISLEIREYATKRMKEINEAYSKLKSIRGMK